MVAEWSKSGARVGADRDDKSAGKHCRKYFNKLNTVSNTLTDLTLSATEEHLPSCSFRNRSFTYDETDDRTMQLFTSIVQSTVHIECGKYCSRNSFAFDKKNFFK